MSYRKSERGIEHGFESYFGVIWLVRIERIDNLRGRTRKELHHVFS